MGKTGCVRSLASLRYERDRPGNTRLADGLFSVECCTYYTVLIYSLYVHPVFV